MFYVVDLWQKFLLKEIMILRKRNHALSLQWDDNSVTFIRIGLEDIWAFQISFL
jgi:hypothetical protein